MPEHPYLQWPVFRRSVVAAFQRSLTGSRRIEVERASMKRDLRRSEALLVVAAVSLSLGSLGAATMLSYLLFPSSSSLIVPATLALAVVATLFVIWWTRRKSDGSVDAGVSPADDSPRHTSD
jgi:hypothetical protein